MYFKTLLSCQYGKSCLCQWSVVFALKKVSYAIVRSAKTLRDWTQASKVPGQQGRKRREVV